MLVKPNRTSPSADVQIAGPADLLSALLPSILQDHIAPALDPRDLVHLASCSRHFRATLAPTLMLQSPRLPHRQSVAASPAAALRQIMHEATVADIEQGFDTSGLILGRGTVMAWTSGYVTLPLPRNIDDDRFERPEARALTQEPCVAMAARRGAVTIALPASGAPYPLRQELLPKPFFRRPKRLVPTTTDADPMGRNLGFQPTARRTPWGSGWHVAMEHGLRTYDVSGQRRLGSMGWPFRAIGAVADINRLWVLDDTHQVHTWRGSTATGLPGIAWEIPSSSDRAPLWAAGGGGRLVVAHGRDLTLATVDGVHAPLVLPSHVAQPTALAFIGQSYLGIGDAQGQITLCHWPSGRFSSRFELGSINGHVFDANDPVLAMVSDGPQRLYTVQKSGILRRLSAPFAPDNSEA